MPTLGVNIDHVATLRQARREEEPDPVEAAAACERAGADGITVHLREDRRHIQEHDVRRLRLSVTTHLNLEMATTPAMLEMAASLAPDMATLVPERREELTTEGGLEVASRVQDVARAVAFLQERGIPVSLFIEPEPAQVDAAVKTGARLVEFHTGAYARAFARGEAGAEFERVRAAAAAALAAGLKVNMGHGLNYVNVEPIARLEGVWELNIGHSIISRALMVGMEQAVREMKALVAGNLQGTLRIFFSFRLRRLRGKRDNKTPASRRGFRVVRFLHSLRNRSFRGCRETRSGTFTDWAFWLSMREYRQTFFPESVYSSTDRIPAGRVTTPFR